MHWVGEGVGASVLQEEGLCEGRAEPKAGPWAGSAVRPSVVTALVDSGDDTVGRSFLEPPVPASRVLTARCCVISTPGFQSQLSHLLKSLNSFPQL